VWFSSPLESDLDRPDDLGTDDVMTKPVGEAAMPSPSETVAVGGARVATRSFGKGEPLLLLNRFRGTMDNWDPALVDGLARDRRVIAFDSLGVGETDGETPTGVEACADFAALVAHSLGLGTTDILGYSLGGEVAQVLALKHPKLVRKLLLAATMPPGGAPEVAWSSKWLETARGPVPSVETAMALFYTKSEASQKAGRASFARMPRPPAAVVSWEAMAAQARAIESFGKDEGGWYPRLKDIAAPTFVANGDRDGLFPAIDSFVLAREIPGSTLSIYPDSGHGFLFQYAGRFVEDALRFLNE
jgi:pimeloyl-ACP methyl ester carboxylesterase